MIQQFKVFYCSNCDEVTLQPKYIESITCPKCDKKMTYYADIKLDTRKVKNLIIDKGLADLVLVAVPRSSV